MTNRPGGIRPLSGPVEAIRGAFDPKVKYDCTICLDTRREEVDLDDDRRPAIGYCSACMTWCRKCKWILKKEHKCNEEKIAT